MTVKKILLLITSLFMLSIVLHAQQDTTSHSGEQEEDGHIRYMPTVGVGTGFFTFFGDVTNKPKVNPQVSNLGYTVTLSRNLSPSFELHLNFLSGYITGNERTVDRNLNFKSQIFLGAASVSYNFEKLLKPNHIINPFISVGVAGFSFSPKGDLKDAKGNTYNYWKDGSIRNVPENSPGAENSIILTRDYNYETDLRKANLDSLGKYSEFAFSFPVEVGINFQISKRANMKLSSTFYYTTTDLIDNVSSKGKGLRHGNGMNDMFLFSAASFHFNLYHPRKEKEKSIYDDVDFYAIDRETAQEEALARKEDKEHIGNITGETAEGGIASDTIAVDRDKAAKFYPGMKDLFGPVAVPETPKPGLTGKYEKFKKLDTNNDNHLSVEEVTQQIDRFFEGDKSYTIEEIYELIDYMFEQ